MADVARRAGVSMATASRALAHVSGVAPATRSRVLRAAEDLSYVVSPEASTLSSGHTGRVGVVVPHLARWYFGEMVEGVHESLRRAGLDLVVYLVPDIDERRDFFFRLPARRKVDAVLVIGVPVTEEERDRLGLLGVSIVAAGGQNAPYPYVSIDDLAAGRQAMDHLVYLRHRRIAMIDAIDPNDLQWPVDGRALAYTSVLDEQGIPLRREYFQRVGWGAEDSARAMERLLSLRVPPTAVLAHSDEMAFGALRTLRRAGVRVPQDMSVIGIDDHPLAAMTDLTTVHQDVRLQGEIAGETVVRVLAGEDVDRSVVLPTYIIPRGTTAPPSKDRAGAPDDPQ